MCTVEIGFVLSSELIIVSFYGFGKRKEGKLLPCEAFLWPLIGV